MIFLIGGTPQAAAQELQQRGLTPRDVVRIVRRDQLIGHVIYKDDEVIYPYGDCSLEVLDEVPLRRLKGEGQRRP